MTEPVVRVYCMEHAMGLEVKRSSSGAAGYDLVCAVRDTDSIVLLPNGGRALIPTGLVLSIPEGYEGQIRPRSGLALNNGVTVLNAPGTIDSDYRGEVGVILINHGKHPFYVERGMRIAQLVFAPVTQVKLENLPFSKLDNTTRGSGGFGSTGLK